MRRLVQLISAYISFLAERGVDMKRLGWLVYAGFFFFLLLAMGLLRGHAKTTQDLSELVQEVKTLGPEAFDAAVRVVEAYKDRTSDAVSICQGRLTLTTALPVTTSDVTNAGTIYFAPYNS